MHQKMKTLDQYLEDATVAHGHICAGQVLGVRLAMLGLRELGIEDPIRERKRIVTYVEIDRCMTDAVALVANCRLGKRALKFLDWGKVAATFVDLESGRAIRIVAREDSKKRANEMFPALEKEKGQQQAYRVIPDEELFDKQWVRVEIHPEDLPGFKGPRVVCAQCGEGINFKREVSRNGRTLCRCLRRRLLLHSPPRLTHRPAYSRGTACRARTRYKHTRAIQSTARFEMLRLDFSRRDEWHDRVKLVCRARPAVPLLQKNAIARGSSQVSVAQAFLPVPT